MIPRKLRSILTRANRALTRRGAPLDPVRAHLDLRVALTLSCRDTDSVPKVARAGEVIRFRDRPVQVMHDGSLVEAGGYHGEWMARIIRGLRGHHEPQEELLFHHLLAHCRSGSRMIEVGASWAYYTNWYLGAVSGSTAVCVEPDAQNLACGQRNLALNDRVATWVNASVGGEAGVGTLRRESDGATVRLPCHSLDSLLELVGRGPVEMLHIDCQGAETAFLGSLGPAAREGLLRFVFVSTHHATISGSPTTHEDCLRELEGLGATVLCEHPVDESFSGDGLIVASLQPGDSRLELPEISRHRGKPLFPATVARPCELAHTVGGPMLVFADDGCIGRALVREGRGDEDAVKDVVRFLRRRHGFRPRLLVDVGANVGTHLLGGLRDGTFPRGIGVEMDPDNFRLLTGNVHLADCHRRARLFEAAISETEGAVTIELSRDNFGDHRVRTTSVARTGDYGELERATRVVPALTLAGLETAYGTAFDEGTLLWIDTQGHEGHVLAGAGDLFRRERRPFVVIEFWPYGLERAEGRERVFRFLRDCRAIHNLGVSGWERQPSTGAAALEAWYNQVLAREGSGRREFTDLLCLT
jgi:FkbM family methyltransferase